MIVYRAVNSITNKCYVGQTIRSLKFRKYTHEYAVRVGKKSKFLNAIRSYGVDQFVWEVLAECATKEELDQLECFYISQFDSIKSGYNTLEGGSGAYVKKRKTYEERWGKEGAAIQKALRRDRMREHNKVYGFNVLDKEVQRQYASLGSKRRSELGYTHSEKTKQKIRKSNQISHKLSPEEKSLQAIKMKEAMRNVDKKEAQRKATEGRQLTHNKKTEATQSKIQDLLQQGLKAKQIMSELNISSPTYYKHRSAILLRLAN